MRILDCPVCKESMITVESGGVEIDWCGACEGLWLDGGELEALVGTPNPPPERPDASLGPPDRDCRRAGAVPPAPAAGCPPALSNRYVTLARKISMKFKVRIPTELKRRFCKHCYKYLMPGKTVRIRTHKGKVVYNCLNCKKFMRFMTTKQ